MGLLGNLLGKKEENKELAEKEKINSKENSAEEEGKYSEPCALCNNPGTDKKWAGQYWHRKCIRKAKKVAKGML